MRKKYTFEEFEIAIRTLKKLELEEYMALVSPPSDWEPAFEANRTRTGSSIRTMLGRMYEDMHNDIISWLDILSKDFLEIAIEYGLENAE